MLLHLVSWALWVWSVRIHHRMLGHICFTLLLLVKDWLSELLLLTSNYFIWTTKLCNDTNGEHTKSCGEQSYKRFGTMENNNGTTIKISRANWLGLKVMITIWWRTNYDYTQPQVGNAHLGLDPCYCKQLFCGLNTW